MKTNNKNNIGHRSRLRDKLLRNGLSGFLDYEIVELLLIIGTPRKDCKQQAKQLLKKFGNLSKLLYASKEELQQVSGIGPKNIWAIIFFRELIKRYKKDSVTRQQNFNSPDEVADYLMTKIGHEDKEHFVVLFFDTKNNLITQNVSIGTLNASVIHPREIFKPAISHSASHIIVAHNHPSGDPSPSKADIATTKQLIKTGEIIGIPLIDHIVVSQNSYVSFKQQGYIK